MARTVLDVTDLVEFLGRQESVSGVQRVIAEVGALLIDDGVGAIALDRGRGVFVDLVPAEVDALLRTGVRAGVAVDRSAVAAAADSCLARARTAPPSELGTGTVVVFLGAVWISDALMMAARAAHAAGARCVYLVYDLTPVLETGHTGEVRRLFERYLTLVTQTGSAAPAISESSRRDYQDHCASRGLTAPPGGATGLPCGLGPKDVGADAAHEPAWPRPFVLFVGTVEARKNHLLALRAWQRLLDERGASEVPDLVCVGRLGWNASEFLAEYVATGGLGGKVSVLSASLPDDVLGRLYADCLFTIYPSRYEGWGLPVSESLAFGKVPITARTSSLPEAGRDLAVYFASDDLDDFVAALVRDGLDPARRTEHEQRIARDGTPPITWRSVADTIRTEAERAATGEGRSTMHPRVELGHEYALSVATAAPDTGYADQYLGWLHETGLTPLLRQPRADGDTDVVDAAVIGAVGAPQTWGYELRPGSRIDLRITRPVSGPLVVLLATRSMPGTVTVDAAGLGGPVRTDVALGSVLRLPLGDGNEGEGAQVTISCVDAHDSLEGFIGLRSFVVLAADDARTQVIALESAATALRTELDYVTGTRSWRMTKPLRRKGGRG